MTDRDLRARVIDAINGSPYKWRTVRGVAKDVGAKYEAVEEVLVKSGAFVRAKSPNKRGEALYSTTERYKKETPFIDRLFGAAANTVSS